jgi:hypothetical protein
LARIFQDFFVYLPLISANAYPYTFFFGFQESMSLCCHSDLFKDFIIFFSVFRFLQVQFRIEALVVVEVILVVLQAFRMEKFIDHLKGPIMVPMQ